MQQQHLQGSGTCPMPEMEVNMQELLICAFCCSMRIDNNDLDAAHHEHRTQSGMNVDLNAAERRSPSLLMVSMTAKG